MSGRWLSSWEIGLSENSTAPARRDSVYKMQENDSDNDWTQVKIGPIWPWIVMAVIKMEIWICEIMGAEYHSDFLFVFLIAFCTFGERVTDDDRSLRRRGFSSSGYLLPASPCNSFCSVLLLLVNSSIKSFFQQLPPLYLLMGGDNGVPRFDYRVFYHPSELEPNSSQTVVSKNRRDASPGYFSDSWHPSSPCNPPRLWWIVVLNYSIRINN